MILCLHFLVMNLSGVRCPPKCPGLDTREQSWLLNGSWCEDRVPWTPDLSLWYSWNSWEPHYREIRVSFLDIVPSFPWPVLMFLFLFSARERTQPGRECTYLSCLRWPEPGARYSTICHNSLALICSSTVPPEVPPSWWSHEHNILSPWEHFMCLGLIIHLSTIRHVIFILDWYMFTALYWPYYILSYNTSGPSGDLMYWILMCNGLYCKTHHCPVYRDYSNLSSE